MAPPTVGAGEVWRVNVKGSGPAGQFMNVWHFKALTGSADLDAISLDIKTDICETVKGQMENSWQFNELHWSRLSIPPVVYDYTYGAASVGAKNNLAMPAQDSLVVTLRTAYAGRSYRGRSYLAGLAFDQLDQADANWAAAAVSGIQTQFDTFAGKYASGGTDTDWRWIVWSRKLGEVWSGGSPGVGTLTSYNLTAGAHDIVDTIARAIPAVIRRRRFGVGS